jgi:peroxiredoxin
MTITLNLTPAAVALAAADVIERQGKAHGNYYDKASGKDPREAPVDVLGALAIAGGFDPHTWEDDRDATGQWRLVLDTADLLIDALGLDHDEAYAESLGGWSDERYAAAVIDGLTCAALEVLV